MPDLSNQRRLASILLKCGSGRVWIDPAREQEVSDSVTRQDIRTAIKSGAIRRRAIQGTSRARARRYAAEVAKGRHQGPGSRRGSPLSRSTKKERWMRRIRPQRELLATLRADQRITPAIYRRDDREAKGGMYRSRAHLLLNLRLAGHLAAEAKS